MIDYTAVLTWAGELTGAMLAFVLIGFLLSRVR